MMEVSRANKWNTISYIVVSLVNFVVFTIAFKKFDFNLVGYYVLITSVFILGGNLDLGFGVSTVKLISFANKKNDKKYIKEFFYTFLLVYFILVAIILVLQYLYYIFFLKNLVVPQVDLIKAEYIYLFVALNFSFSFIYTYFRYLLEGLFFYVFVSKVIITLNILFLIISVISIYLYNDIVIFISVNSLISILILAIFFIKIIGSLDRNIDTKLFNSELVKKNLSYSFKVQISFFIGNSIDYLIKYLITIFLFVGMVSIYESGKKFITFINGFIYSTQKTFIIRISEVISDKVNQKEIYPDLLKYSSLSVYLLIFFYSIINPVICLFIIYWFNNIDSVYVFLLLSLPQLFISFLISIYNIILIEGRGLFIILIQSLNVIFVVLFSVIWFTAFDSLLGLVGYYFATLITSIIIFRYMQKHHSFDVKDFLEKINFKKVLLLNFLIFAQIYLLKSYGNYYLVLSGFQVIYLLFYYKELIFVLKKLRINILKIIR